MKAPKAVRKKRRTLYIRNPVVHRLPEQLGKRMGLPLTDAAIAALDKRLPGYDAFGIPG